MDKLNKADQLNITQALIFSGMWVLAAKTSTPEEFSEVLKNGRFAPNGLPWKGLHEQLLFYTENTEKEKKIAKDMTPEQSLRSDATPLNKKTGHHPSGDEHWTRKAGASSKIKKATAKTKKIRKYADKNNMSYEAAKKELGLGA